MYLGKKGREVELPIDSADDNIARKLKTEDITYDELVLRLAFFLSGIKDTWELHRMVDYVKEYRKSVGMS